MNNYKQVYMGGSFDFYIKYTSAMNITFTAMMYGISMPILFPLAAVSIYNQNLCERIQVAWVYKLPPKLGDKLTRDVLHLLRFAPLFLLFNSYWLMDN